MRVSRLRIYPVKSAAGYDVTDAVLHPWGLADDRRWMVIDSAGDTVTARAQRRLLKVTATPQPDGGLVLAAPERPDLRVPSVGGNRSVEVTLSRVATALDAGDAVATWLSEWLGLPVRLVWLDDPTRRTVSPDHGGALGDVLNLADAGPIHLTSTTSLARLNDWLLETAMDRGEDPPDPLPMVRFRPGVVVDDVAEPFVEDEWRRVMIGSTELRFSEHCDRCVLPTIDPVTLTSTHEPTRTLARHRQWDHKVHFGVRLVPVTTGTLRVGDEVRPI